MEGLIRTLPSGWRDAVLVCGKCSKKVGGGFGKKGRTPLAKLLRKALALKGRKARAGVVETRCLGVCPKGAVMVVHTARTDTWLIVAAGTPAGEVIARLRVDQA